MPDPTWVPDRRASPSPTGLSPPLVPFSKGFGSARPIPRLRPRNPDRCPGRFGLVPVRSPLLRESRLISSPPGTEMFQFPGLFGHSGIDARWAASPDISQPSTPEFLMTPRHSPRALGSLTTPIGAPRSPAILVDASRRSHRRRQGHRVPKVRSFDALDSCEID